MTLPKTKQKCFPVFCLWLPSLIQSDFCPQGIVVRRVVRGWGLSRVGPPWNKQRDLPWQMSLSTLTHSILTCIFHANAIFFIHCNDEPLVHTLCVIYSAAGLMKVNKISKVWNMKSNEIQRNKINGFPHERIPRLLPHTVIHWEITTVQIHLHSDPCKKSV